MNFKTFKTAVATQFAAMTHSTPELYRANISGDELWDLYLGSFPEGSDPIYRERRGHDCSCCKQFIRTVGNVVAIQNGKLVSMWGTVVRGEPAYQQVADALSAAVTRAGIADKFLHYEHHAGTDKNFEQVMDEVVTWEHFYVNLPSAYCVNKAYIPTQLGERRSTKDVFLRGLNELTIESLDTVLELIAQGSLYRGAEHMHTLTEFRKLKVEFVRCDDDESRDLFAWQHSGSVGSVVSGAITRVRNTSIGTLLIDLSAGTELEEAVRKFEAVVAPSNYKRPTALVTAGMVAKAKKAIEELGLTSALSRRFATLDDLSVQNVLFVDRSASVALAEPDLFDGVASRGTPKLGKTEEISIEKFVTDVLPLATGVEVLVENRLVSNFVSLLTATDPTAPMLFKWNNPFSWAYGGDVADSVKERVKKAGGNVTGDLCCRLSWSNTDDLDIHMRDPGAYISFMDKHPPCTTGRQDVDMNISGETRTPVENIFYPSRAGMREGKYELSVHNYRFREATDPGFEVEIDYLGNVTKFAYPQILGHGKTVVVATFEYSHAGGIKFLSSLPASNAVRTAWGLTTQSFAKVNTVLLSPNFWDGEKDTGNKHYLFMLNGCTNETSPRGFFNEFLKGELTPHRKVLELVGSKVRADEVPNQLSGLGFSSTQRNHVICRVSGSFTRTLKVTF